MKRTFLVSLIAIQACIAFAQNAQNRCVNDTTFREIRFPLTEQDTKPVFCYINNEWIAGVSLDKVPADSIQKFEVRNDEFNNRAIFLTVSPETVSKLKSDIKDLWINFDPICEFPGGNGKLKEWLDANIRVPEGYKGSERVVVSFYVQPDGSLTDFKIVKNSINEAANAEALRLVNELPKFRVKFFTPRKHRIGFLLPITFTEPGAIFIKGGASSFIEEFPIIEHKIRLLYENEVFGNTKDANFKMSDICTAEFLQRLSNANDFDTEGYATWLLRSGMQDGEDSPSRVVSVVPGKDNTVIVHWSDMGYNGSTTFSMVESDGVWKINGATVPDGYNPL